MSGGATANTESTPQDDARSKTTNTHGQAEGGK